MVVSQLFIYPLKSARGIELERIELDRHGPVFDRQWMVVTPQGKFVTQRQLPKMCLIETRLIDGCLGLGAPGMPSILVSGSGKQSGVIVWKDSVQAVDCGDAAADWLSTYLGRSCRLVKMPTGSRRLVDQDYAHSGETVRFADGFPLLIVSQASLDDFNSKLEHSIGMERFRPNIVIDGCRPFAEDEWRELTIGELILSIVKPCSRCIIPSIDPLTGEKQMVVNEALFTHRRRDHKAFFGQNALLRNTGRIDVGEQVVVSLSN